MCLCLLISLSCRQCNCHFISHFLSLSLSLCGLPGPLAQVEALKEENDSLRCQLDAYRNEVELLKQEQGKAQPQRSEEDATRQQQLSFLQQALQGMQKVPLTVNTSYRTKSLLSHAEGTTHSQHIIQNKITFVSCRRYHSQSTRHTAQNHFCLVQKVPLTVNTAYSTKSLFVSCRRYHSVNTPNRTKSLLSRAEGTTHSQHAIQHKITFCLCRRYHSQSTHQTEQNHFCLVQKVPLTVNTPYSTKSLLSRAEGTTHSQHAIQHKITFVSCRRYHSQSTHQTEQNHFCLVQKVPLTVNTPYRTKSLFVSCRRYHSQSTRHTAQNHFCLVQKVPLTVNTPYSTKSLLSRAEGTTHSQHGIQHKITFVSCRRYHSQSTRHTAQNHFCLVQKVPLTVSTSYRTKSLFVSCRRYHSQSAHHTAQNHFLSRAEGTTHSQHAIQNKITFVSCRRYHSQSTRHTEQNHFCLVQKVPLTVNTPYRTKSLFVSFPVKLPTNHSNKGHLFAFIIIII